MGVLDFMKVKKGSSATQVAEMEASLERVRAEMTQATAIIESHGQRRADMLLSDAVDTDIARLDADVALAQIRIERLELAELELQDRIAAARDSDQRSRKAAEYERAAAAIAAKTSAIDEAARQFASAYSDLLAVIPADLIDARIMKPHFSVDGAAAPVDIASAIAGQSLASHCPELFENHRPRTRTHGDACAKTLSVLDTDRSGRLSPVLAGERGEHATISSADKAAQRFVVDPLRDKARALRGSAEMAQAAE